MAVFSLNNFLLGKQFIGVEHFSLNSEDKIALLLVEKKKEGLIIAKKDRVSYNGKIAEKWDFKLPFFLIVNSSQVIQKEVAGNDVADEKLLYKSFPNTNWDDFYYEIWRLEAKSVIAITRKSYLDNLLEGYKEQKIHIAGISLGVCSLADILEYTDRQQFFTNNQLVAKDESPSVSQNTLETAVTYTINDLNIENRQLLSFSGVLRLLLNITSNTGSVLYLSEKLRDNFYQNSFFSKGVKVMVGFVFGLLVLNFIFFSHYYKLAQESAEIVLVNKASTEDVKKIQKRIVLKEEKVKSINGRMISNSSLLINEITSKIPNSILLNELTFNPLEKNIKAEEPIITNDKLIVISGATISSSDFTAWVEQLERLKWVDKILITHFGKNEENETTFSINLTTK